MKWLETTVLAALIVLLGYRWFDRPPRVATEGIRFGEEFVLAEGPARATLLYGSSTEARSGPPADTLRVVTDFQCPFCRQLHYTLDSLASTHAFAVQLVHLPLIEIHPRAFAAAVAFECAAEQARPRAMHDFLFDSAAHVQASRWDELAALSGVPDKARFSFCLESKSATQRVREDRRSVLGRGVTSTPTVVLSGRRLVGRLSMQALGDALDERRP